jgi:thiamine-monophosphate kinase
VTALGPGGEFDRLRGVFRRLADAGTLGDDCALVTVGGVALAIACDMTVEGRHFRRDWLRAGELGWRAAAAALSDLAAVAATPRGVLAAVALPASLPPAFLEDLMEGVAGAARAAGAELWGGDLTADDRIVMDVTVIGSADRPVRRAGARPGDTVWVTGRFGGPRAAVAAWEAGGQPDPATRARFARPVPRITEATWLRDQGATAMIDVSDGLAGDAGHLAAASGVALTLAADAVPRHAGARGWEDAVQGGEEYELLVTLPAAFAAPPAWLTRVGTVAEGAGVTWTLDGRPVSVGGGYSHF